MRVALYARVSSEAQEARGTIGSQVEALRARAAEEQHEIVKEFLDNGHSGARLDRPGLDALRDAAVAGAFEVVLVLSPDRLARNFAYQMVVLDEFKLHSVEVRFLDTPDFADDPQSRLLTQIQGVVAEYERAKIMERNRRGKLYRSRLGEIISWKAPYGYQRIPRGPDGPAHLVVNQPEATVVRRIFDDAVSAGLSLRQIAKGLLRDGISSPEGRPCWSPSGLGYLLQNETYFGRYYYNRTETVPAPPGSRCPTRQRPRPREEWIRIPVPAIVSEDVFGAAQQVSRENAGFSPRRAEPGAFLLRRLAVCGVCGVKLGCRGRTERTGKRYRYYCCPKHDSLRAGGEDRRCSERHIRAEALDDFVLAKVKETLLRPEILLAGEAALTSSEPAADQQILQDQIARLERRHQAAERERRRLLDAFQAGLVEFTDLRRRTEEVDSRRATLAAERDGLGEQQQSLLEKGRLRRRIGDFAGRVLAALDGLDFEESQRLIRLVVEQVRITGAKVEIHFRIPLDEPPDGPGTGPRPPHKTPPEERVSSNERLRPIGSDEHAVRGLQPESPAKRIHAWGQARCRGRLLGGCQEVLRLVLRADGEGHPAPL